MNFEYTNMDEYERELYNRAIENTAIRVYLTTELGEVHHLPPSDYQAAALEELEVLVDILELPWNIVAQDVVAAIDHLPKEIIAALDVPSRPVWGHHA